jgi:hypothetical protein
MPLSKRAFGQIIAASAQSESPIEDEVLREIAEERGSDPDALIKQHNVMRDEWKLKKSQQAQPMPLIIP